MFDQVTFDSVDIPAAITKTSFRHFCEVSDISALHWNGKRWFFNPTTNFHKQLLLRRKHIAIMSPAMACRQIIALHDQQNESQSVVPQPRLGTVHIQMNRYGDHCVQC